MNLASIINVTMKSELLRINKVLLLLNEYGGPPSPILNSKFKFL